MSEFIYVSSNGSGAGSSVDDPLSIDIAVGSSDPSYGVADFFVTTIEVSAADLNSLDARSTGLVDASTATALIGTVEAVAAAYASSAVIGLGDEAVTLSETSAAAADLNAVDAATTGLVDATTVTTLTGTSSAVATAYASSGITGLGDEAVMLSETSAASADLNAIDAATTGLVDATTVTTLTGTVSAVATAYASSGITGLGNEAVTLSDSSAAAGDLNEIDARTTDLVSATSVTMLAGTAAEVAAAYASSGISGLGDEAVTLSDAGAAAAHLNEIEASTTGLVNASLVTTLTGPAAAVVTSYDAGSAGRITGLGNEAVILSDTTLTALFVNAIDSKTIGLIDASSITTLTGTAATVAAAYASRGIANLGGAAVTLSDTNVAAKDLKAIDAGTDGVIDATTVTTLTGTAADVTSAYASNGITGLGNEAVTLSETSAAAADLSAIDARTTGLVNASSVTTLTGTAADVAAAYASNGISRRGNEAVRLSDISAAAADLNEVDAKTTGLVNASSVATLVGTTSAVVATYDSGSAGTITGLGNEAVVLSDTTAVAAVLHSIDGRTIGLIDAASLTSLTGTAAMVAAVYTARGIANLGDEAVTLSDTNASAAALIAIDAGTTGLLDAATVTTLTGTAATVASAYAASGITGLGNEGVTLSDKTAAAGNLNDIDAATIGLVNANTLTALTGTSGAVAAAYESGGITGLGNEAVRLSDMTAAAADLSTIDARTTGLVNASSLSTLTGTAAAVASVYASGSARTITGLGNEAVVLSDTTVAVAILHSIDARTIGLINAASLTALTGTAATVAAAYAARGIANLGDETVTLSDTNASAAALTAIDARTTGLLDAATVTTLTGTAAAVAAAYAASGITGLGNEGVTLSDKTAAAASLNDIDAATTGLVNANTVTALTGTSAAISAAYLSDGITGLGNESVKLSDMTAAAADLNTIDARTTGLVNASSVTTLTGTAEAVASAYASSSARTITGLGNEAVVLSDTTVAAAILNTVDARTIGMIDASTVTTLTGSTVTIAAAFASRSITGLDNAALNVVGTSATDAVKGSVWNDTLSGDAGNDVLTGGNGNDLLTGGAGADVFVFNFALNESENIDTITDFLHGTDRIHLSAAVMSAIGSTGLLNSAAFYQGAGIVAGQDNTDRILYDTSTGGLYYDADGNGIGAAVQFGQLGTAESHPMTLDYADFLII